MDAHAIRESGSLEPADLTALYRAAFPGEDLLPLVHDLLAPPVRALSLGAFDGPVLAGHILFTPGRVEGYEAAVALLGPLAVAPARQRLGIGTALVKAGLERLASEGVARVLVLGDPAYYGRFGFERETGVTPPYALPPGWAGAWQGTRAPVGLRIPPGPRPPRAARSLVAARPVGTVTRVAKGL